MITKISTTYSVQVNNCAIYIYFTLQLYVNFSTNKLIINTNTSIINHAALSWSSIKIVTTSATTVHVVLICIAESLESTFQCSLHQPLP